MAVEVVLLNNVDKLGNVGETVRVSDGYARNYLFPQKLAVCATKAVLKQIEASRQKVEAEYQAAVAAAQEIAAKVNETSITIPMQAGDDEKLFGSVSVTDITNLLTAEGIEVEKRRIAIGEPIRTLGVHEVSVQLHSEVTATLKVWVVKA